MCITHFRKAEWQNSLQEFGVFFTPVTLNADGTLRSVRCNYCRWGHDKSVGVSANVTRCAQHMEEKHKYIYSLSESADASQVR